MLIVLCKSGSGFHSFGAKCFNFWQFYNDVSSSHMRELKHDSVFETRTATGRKHFACLDRIVSQSLILPVSNGEKILSNVNVVV